MLTTTVFLLVSSLNSLLSCAVIIHNNLQYQREFFFYNNILFNIINISIVYAISMIVIVFEKVSLLTNYYYFNKNVNYSLKKLCVSNYLSLTFF